MRRMLNQDAQCRPPVKAVVDAGYFKDDRMLRALRFIDTILQRETAQKHAFISDLPSFLPQIPKRVLRLQVLPCLIQQWQDSALRDAVLPLVLRMVKSLPADIFQNQVRLPSSWEGMGDMQLLIKYTAVRALGPHTSSWLQQGVTVQVLPELKGILSSASGTQVTQVLRAVPDLQQAMRVDQVEDTLIPVMLKALGAGDTRLQEEVCLIDCSVRAC